MEMRDWHQFLPLLVAAIPRSQVFLDCDHHIKPCLDYNLIPTLAKARVGHLYDIHESETPGMKRDRLPGECLATRTEEDLRSGLCSE